MHGPVNLGLAEDALRSAEARKQAKRERAAAMDNIVQLLLERAEVRAVVGQIVNRYRAAPGYPCVTQADIEELRVLLDL